MRKSLLIVAAAVALPFAALAQTTGGSAGSTGTGSSNGVPPTGTGTGTGSMGNGFDR